MKLYYTLLLNKFILFLLFFQITNLKLYSEDIAIPDIYSITPDIANCKEGALKESEKQRVLDYVNKIRAIHGLKPVIYDHSGDEAAMKGAMVCVANASIQHDIPTNWQCYTDKAKYGTMNSNLYIQWQGAPNYPQSEVSIISWMYDLNQPQLGHRRAIINPFLSQISFGRSDGTPKVQTQYKYVTSMSLKYLDNLNQKITDTDIEFVAYPHNNYPPVLFNKNWLLSFTAIYDRTNWWNNQNVDYSSAVIEVKDPQNRTMNVHSISYDNQGWGGLMNCLKWRVDGLQDGVTYSVKISNIKVNNINKTYTYWFNLQDTGGQNPPGQVALSEPSSGATNTTTDILLKWNSVLNTSSYQLQLSEIQNMSQLILDIDVGNATSYSLSNLKPTTKYYWRVLAKNSYGNGPWSEIWNFTTQQQSAIAPGLILPPDNEIMESLTPKFFWTAVKDAKSYQLQVATNRNFLAQTLVINAQYINTIKYSVAQTSKLAESRNYYWRVRQQEPSEGLWSDVYTFTTKPAELNGPSLVYPLEGEINVTAKPKCIWGSIAGTSKYQLQIAQNDDFIPNDMHLSKFLSYDTYYQITESEKLKFETIYYWRVRAFEPEISPETSLFRTGDITSVHEYRDLIDDLSIQCFPNPITDNAIIQIYSENSIDVLIEIHNLFGEKVKEIFNGTINSGYNIVEFDFNHLSGGAYFIKVRGSKTNKSLIIQYLK